MNVLNVLNVRYRVGQRVASVLLLSMLAACASREIGAPVIDRTFGGPAAGTAAPTAENTPVPPGYYRVKPGDNLYRIALNNGQRFSDIARWNNISDPNQIEVGQLVRVVPPAGDVTTNPVPTPGTPTPGGMPPPAASGPSMPASGPNTGITGPAPVPAVPPEASGPAASGISLMWPARGQVTGTFNDSSNKGINIAGTEGEPVVAAAAGKVVYAGNGLRGYGNLVIIKHDATFLTAYAHNRTLLVKEGDNVQKGQKIAEMGKSDATNVALHFEVRRQGKPVDPMKYLPPQ